MLLEQKTGTSFKCHYLSSFSFLSSHRSDLKYTLGLAETFMGKGSNDHQREVGYFIVLSFFLFFLSCLFDCIVRVNFAHFLSLVMHWTFFVY